MATTTSRGKGNGRRRVCLFGTSANPPTGDGGHRGIVLSLASSADDFDEVRVLPVYRHMFENKRGNQASFDDRVTMCKLAFDGIPKVVVSEAERTCFEKAANGLNDREKSSVKVGTADLLDMLIADEPNTDFAFALGADTFMDLTEWKWRRSHDVVSLLQGRIMVIYRAVDHGSPIFCEKDLQERIRKVNEEQFAREKDELVGGKMPGDADLPQQRAKLMRIPSLSTVSSSLVRSTNDESKLHQLITPDVLAYIKLKELYAFSREGED